MGYVEKVLSNNERIIYRTHQHIIVLLERLAALLFAVAVFLALGLTVLMAEQNFEQATRIADRGYVLVHGRVELAADNVEELRRSDVVQRLYLGID